MRIVVPVRAVPDLVEEIELTADETGIDRDYLKFVVSEWDAQALEEALLVKDSSGADVVAVGLACDPDIDQALYTALARPTTVTSAPDESLTSSASSSACASHSLTTNLR